MTLVSINTTSSFHLLVVHTDTISDSLFLCVCSEWVFFIVCLLGFFFVIVIVVVLFLLLFVCFPQSVLDFHLLLSHWQDKQVQNQLTSCLPLWCCKDRTGTAVSSWKYQGEKKHDEIKVISSFNKLNWGRRQKEKKILIVLLEWQLEISDKWWGSGLVLYTETYLTTILTG